MTQYRWYENFSNYTYQTLNKLNSNIYGEGLLQGGLPYVVSTNVIGITPYTAIFEDGTIIEDTDPPTITWTPQISPIQATLQATHLSTDLSGGNPAEISLINGIINTGVIFGWFCNPGSMVNLTATQLWQKRYNKQNSFSLHDWYIQSSSSISVNPTNILIALGGNITITKALKGDVVVALFDTIPTIITTATHLDGSSITPTINLGSTLYHNKYPYIIRFPSDFEGYLTLNITSPISATTLWGLEVGYNIDENFVTI